MEDVNELKEMDEVTEDDRLWAALSWVPVTPLWPVVALLALLLEEQKDRPFIRYHAVLSLVSGILLIPVSILTLGCGTILYLVFFYYALLAYQGQRVEVPFVSDWAKRQGWLETA